MRTRRTRDCPSSAELSMNELHRHNTTSDHTS
jgi:hypothetical protein